ncbi:hypothetical protein D3C87_1406870 [compost metagenome]
MLADIKSFDGVTDFVDAEFFQLVGADKHQAISQVLPFLFEYLLVILAIDDMGNLAKALKTAEIVKAIHNENLRKLVDEESFGSTYAGQGNPDQHILGHQFLKLFFTHVPGAFGP